jgi:hypothetical protein
MSHLMIYRTNPSSAFDSQPRRSPAEMKGITNSVEILEATPCVGMNQVLAMCWKCKIEQEIV